MQKTSLSAKKPILVLCVVHYKCNVDFFFLEMLKFPVVSCILLLFDNKNAANNFINRGSYTSGHFI